IGTTCRKCEYQDWDIDGIRSIFKYGGVVRQAIIQFKYDNVKALAEPLAVLMSGYVKTHPLPADIIIPVPIHSHRLRERGYNQSSLLAQRLSRLTSVPMAEGVLIRTRNTPPQAKSSSLVDRRANMVDAFTCNRRRVAGKRILLIDDVCTSGTTLNSCAKPLKAAGAASVWGLTLAKEI
ncbi:MAG: ComF family protein, partial [Chloroflexota bacterium]|nr:ComF family protein [Chloroflexota bacterium]